MTELIYVHSKLLIADDNTVIIGEQGLSGGVWGTGLYLDQSFPSPRTVQAAEYHGLFFSMLSFLS